MSTELTGRSLIGANSGSSSGEFFHAIDPATPKPLEPAFASASSDELNQAAVLATEAFATYSRSTGRDRGSFLRKIAANLESVATAVVERAMQETALPQARLQGEMSRTCGQLRLFAQVIEEGSWVNARIDRPDPDRKPLPKPDIRSMLRPLGPVAVFGASNFPLAFSVAGGDTASALAAGNPVIVKAHPAHPGTSELVGRAIQKSVRDCGFPPGIFSLLFDKGTRIGTELVRHPLVKAAGFTGSRTGGRALMDLAASRPDPIPFYAEMSSTNPVFILPGALRTQVDVIANGLFGSFTMGAGQFCTKPGMVFLPQDSEGIAFSDKLKLSVQQSGPSVLLTPGIHSSYNSEISKRKRQAGVITLAEGSERSTGLAVTTALFQTNAETFSASDLDHEIFGPTMLLVQHADKDSMLAIARSLEGQLTATIHGTEEDLREYAALIEVLENKVGRIIFNGFPTGVEVTHAMVHGGPYPSTSDGRSTSVGSQAIFRFARPVCYQGFPDSALPDELKDSNPLGILRMVDGAFSRDSLSGPR